VVSHAPVCVSSVCADTSRGHAGAAVVRYQGRHQLCQRCPRRLEKVKGMKYKCGPGLMCQKCYDEDHPRKRRAARPKRPASTAAPPTPAPKRVRRTQSDPGEPINLTRKRTRAHPTTTKPPVKKTRVQSPPVDPSLLLDQAHAERLALLAAEKNAATQPVAVKKIVAHPATWRLIICE
jgi:hypothetical protein